MELFSPLTQPLQMSRILSQATREFVSFPLPIYFQLFPGDTNLFIGTLEFTNNVNVSLPQSFVLPCSECVLP